MRPPRPSSMPTTKSGTVAHLISSPQEIVHRESRKSEAIDQLEAKRYAAMKNKAKFVELGYGGKKVKPGVFFYRFMAPLHQVPTSLFPMNARLQMWVPNTIVYDGTSSSFWLYTRDSYVYRTSDYKDAQVISRFGSVNKYELVAVAKTVCQIFPTRSNVMMPPRENYSAAMSNFSTPTPSRSASSPLDAPTPASPFRSL
jgi:hypothetical protein